MADFTVFTDIDTLLQSTSNSAARTNLGLGTAATTAAADYATAAQGATADTALQNGDTFDELIDGTTNKAFTDTEQTKLSGIATGAEVNTINTTSTGEPATSNPVYNVVNISQVDYDAAIVAGTTVTTTFYIIT